MGRNYLIFLLVAGMLASIVTGGGSSDRASNNPEGFDSQVAKYERGKSDNDDQAEAGTIEQGTIELRREHNGHFYADVDINGMPIRVLVDTGASGIALSRDDARRAGLAVSSGMFNVVGEGADGDVHGEFVTLDRVSLGHREAKDVAAVVLDGGEQSLLGQSFLGKFDSVEIRGDTMVLR